MFQIRTTRSSDLPKLARIYASAYNSADVGEQWDTASAERLLAHFLSLQPDLFFATYSGTTPLGAIAGIVKPWWDGNHISDGELFVDPSYQKKNIATKLLKYFTTQSRSLYAITAIDWITFRRKKFPLAWYKRLGFQEVEDWIIISGKPEIILKNIT